MNQLHPGARWLFRFRAYASFLPIFFFFLILSFSLLAVGALIGLFLVLFIIIIDIIIAEIYARMAYNRWFYEIGNDGVKIERGIIWKRYTSIPYERVQNVDIHRGILARMLGYSTLEIQTAGYSGYGAGYGFGLRFGGRNGRQVSEGHIPAVDIEGAEKIREFILKKISKKGGEGL
jgi:membrane protein YdbS with pleckstrin-like domain